MKGLVVHVLRQVDFPDCTRDGVTSRVGRAILVGPGVEGVFEPKPGDAVLVLDPRQKRWPLTPIAVPQEAVKGLADASEWWMFGGNFIYSSDSRFAALNGGNPIAVHDRHEPWREYILTSKGRER